MHPDFSRKRQCDRDPTKPLATLECVKRLLLVAASDDRQVDSLSMTLNLQAMPWYFYVLFVLLFGHFFV